MWLTWFAAAVLERFAPVCERMGERERAAALRAETARPGAGRRKGLGRRMVSEGIL